MDRRFLRPGWIAGHLMVVVAVLVCVRLGKWQLHRSHEATGTIQNLGYAFLWPAFGVAFIFMWIKFLKLEVLKDAEERLEGDQLIADLDDDLQEVNGPAPVEPETAAEPPCSPPDPVAATPSRAVTISVSTIQDTDADDPELTAYNQALANLAEKDSRRAR